MRSNFNRAASARTILSLPFAILAFAMFTSNVARADSGNDPFAGGSFMKFGQETVRREDVSVSRRTVNQTKTRSRQVASLVDSDSDEPAPSRRRASRGRQVASLGRDSDFSAPKPERSLSGGGNIRWVANAGCLDGSLRSAVAAVAANYGSVTVSSTCRSAGHNARVGGAPKSYHLSGNAVDFRVSGNISGAASYLAGLGGGYKHYGGGLFHVDTGPRRSF